MRVVIDSNVYIDGDADDYSYANKIIDEVLTGKIEAFANKPTLRENVLILNREMRNHEYKEKLRECFGHIQIVDTLKIAVVADDEEDNKILASAIAAEADYLITSDRHLLSLEYHDEIQIVDPGTFWERYRQNVLGENDWQKFVSQFLSND